MTVHPYFRIPMKRYKSEYAGLPNIIFVVFPSLVVRLFNLSSYYRFLISIEFWVFEIGFNITWDNKYGNNEGK